ncbi:AAA family ATPase [Paenibacillus sp. OV219]|uniref:AAA family ATPase n=1 Tax=Paenibacillus sp. OV219 TaxID=1884377 RepID=UPI0008AFE0CD|nr:AAA family ATPase [Paenibacillus sp. OV219]SEO06908.1 AAA domain-containing protein [Paenibacillus sp. OV219]
MHSSKIICICGPSGAGKSTLMERTVQQLEDSVSFYFDAYTSTIVSPDPVDVFQRLVDGIVTDPLDIVRNEIRNDKFIEDLQSLYDGNEIIDPWNRRLKPAKYIIVEEPFGRLREGMNELIHTVICIDIPLEISLCRRLIRNLTYDYINEPVDARLEHVLGYIKGYHDGEGMAIRLLHEKLKETSDLRYDGLKPKDELVNNLLAYIKAIS